MKILYIMNVEWNWIKQRPHFLAERLASYHEITLFYPYSYHRKGLGFVNNTSNKLRPYRYFNIPLRGRIKVLETINKIYLKAFFNIVCWIKRPDAIWIGRPQSVDFLPKIKIPLIYDCMDDYYSMHTADDVLRQEQQVLNVASCVFASSESLISKLQRRYQMNTSVSLVRNGYDGKLRQLDDRTKRSPEFTLCYIGTVSSWFDFDLIDKIVSEIRNIRIVVIGPIETVVREKVETYKNSNIVTFVGSIDHDKLYDNVKNYDCLIMPFVLNDIIESVDPVKLYEYINFGKNIITVKYDEILRFDHYVYFYESHEKAVEVIRSLINDNKLKYSFEERDFFLKENSWDNRVKVVNEVLQKAIAP